MEITKGRHIFPSVRKRQVATRFLALRATSASKEEQSASYFQTYHHFQVVVDADESWGSIAIRK